MQANPSKSLKTQILLVYYVFLGYFSLLKDTVCTRIVALWFLSLLKEDNSNVKRGEPKLGVTKRWSPISRKATTPGILTWAARQRSLSSMLYRFTVKLFIYNMLCFIRLKNQTHHTSAKRTSKLRKIVAAWAIHIGRKQPAPRGLILSKPGLDIDISLRGKVLPLHRGVQP